MRMYDIIEKKRDGGILTKEEIEYFVNGYTNGDIPDYQVSALLMAIYFQKLNKEETLNLTLAMEHSGDALVYLQLVVLRQINTVQEVLAIKQHLYLRQWLQHVVLRWQR